MKCIETIKIQAAKSWDTKMESDLAALTDSIRNSQDYQELKEIIFFNHELSPGYSAIFLFWNTEYPTQIGSPLGQRLKQAMKVYGLVDHEIWNKTQTERRRS